MEYAEYGIYLREDSECLSKVKPELMISKSEDKKTSRPYFHEIKKGSCSNGILKQIYEDVYAVVRHLEDMGELLDQRVIL